MEWSAQCSTSIGPVEPNWRCRKGAKRACDWLRFPFLLCVCVPMFVCMCLCFLCDCLLLSLFFSLHSPEFVVSFSIYILELIANESDVCTRMCVCLCVWECVCVRYTQTKELFCFFISPLFLFSMCKVQDKVNWIKQSAAWRRQ